MHMHTHTRHTMTDEQRRAAWDRVAAEMRTNEAGAADDDAQGREQAPKALAAPRYPEIELH